MKDHIVLIDPLKNPIFVLHRRAYRRDARNFGLSPDDLGRRISVATIDGTVQGTIMGMTLWGGHNALLRKVLIKLPRGSVLVFPHEVRTAILFGATLNPFDLAGLA